MAYQFQEFPKHVYNGARDVKGEPVYRVVKDKDEEAAAAKKGFDQARPPAPEAAEEDAPAAEAPKPAKGKPAKDKDAKE